MNTVVVQIKPRMSHDEIADVVSRIVEVKNAWTEDVVQRLLPIPIRAEALQGNYHPAKMFFDVEQIWIEERSAKEAVGQIKLLAGGTDNLPVIPYRLWRGNKMLSELNIKLVVKDGLKLHDRVANN